MAIATEINSSPKATTTIHALNEYILADVFWYLPIEDRLKVEKVCKEWKRISKGSWSRGKKLKVDRNVLSINNCEGTLINQKIFSKILKRCYNYITTLEFIGYNSELNYYATKIIKTCPKLNCIKLSGVSKLVIVTLSKKCFNLTELYLRDITESCDKELSKLFRKNKLKSVELISVRTVTFGQYLLDLPVESLEKFGVFLCSVSAENFMWIVRNATNLTKLAFDDFRVTDESMKAIGHISNLQELQMGTFFPFVKTMEFLCISGNLRKIEISFCKNVNDNFLEYLSRVCTLLTDVNIAGCVGVTNSGVKYLTNLKNLKRLNVDHLNISDDAFSAMPMLEELDCLQCIKLTNNGIANVINICENLEFLNVCYCKVTNALINRAIEATQKRTNNVILKIYVTGTRVRYRKIKKASPRLQVLFSFRQNQAKHYVNVSR